MRFCFGPRYFMLFVTFWTAAARSEVALYFDEPTYLAALQTSGLLTLYEGFEVDDEWGLVRTTVTGGTFSAPDVMSQGVTWNGSGGGIHGVTTSEGAANQGNWGFYSSPHADVPNGINDGFTVSAPQAIYGFGGYLRGTFGADIVFVIDGNDANPIDLGEICEFDPMGEPFNCVDRNLDNTPFVGAIDSNGFYHIEVRETESGGDETKLLFSDDFTLGFQTLPSPRTPGTAWLQPVNGTYGVGANWDSGLPPASDGNALFHLGSSLPYTVSFLHDQNAGQMVVADDHVEFDLGGFAYSLDQSNPTRESIIVGEIAGDDAHLSVQNGTLNGVNAVVAHSTGTTGHVAIGASTVFAMSGQLRIGSGGTGTVEVTAGGQVLSGSTVVGQLSGQGTLDITGIGATLNSGQVTVGDSGGGTMIVAAGGQVTGRDGAIGVAGDGTVVVDGDSSAWTMQISGSARGTLRVGQGDTTFVTSATPIRSGTLTIQNGAMVAAEESYVGDLRNGLGIVNVVGTDSTWISNTSGNAFIGHSGNGVLNVMDGGHVQSGQVLVGRSGVLGETRGEANVDGPGSTWQASSLWVGYNFTTSPFSSISDGKLSITDGGVVTAAQINIGARNAAHGAVFVSGADSRMSATNLLLGPTDANIFNNEASLEIGTGGVVDVTQVVRLENGQLLLQGGLLNASQVLINGGVMGGVGDVIADVENRSNISPGNSTGTISVDGSYEQLATGTLAIELGGLSSGQFDVLEVTQSAQLGGLLELSLIDGGQMFAPQPGDLFEILSADGGVSGKFSSVEGIAISDQLGLAVIYEPNAVVVQTALLADANLDGVVDISDFNIWNSNKFRTETSWQTGDFNGDGLTDASDFNVWNSLKFTSLNQSRAVPEPKSLALLLWAMAFSARVLRRRRDARPSAAKTLG